MPADRLVGRRVPLADVWSPAHARRAPPRSADARSARRWRTWCSPGSRSTGPTRWRPAWSTALDAGRDVREIAERLGLSERQLHRRSLAAFGYGPKTLARIRRLQRALAVPAPVGGAAVAAAAGYADQAHLTREVRALAGVPFGRLRLAGTA